MTDCERTLINLRGYCLFCLKNGDSEQAQSPFATPISSPMSTTPLRNRYQNVHSLPLEERIAPLTDLCRYLNVDIPDCYAFGDGVEPEMLTPPLCSKCHELSARLCLLQDELQYLQLRINNTVKRLYQRVAATCDPRRGALRRESFHNAFRRKSKGSLSRGRAESVEVKKVTSLVKALQLKIVEKGADINENKRRRNTTFLSAQCRNPPEPDDIGIEVELLNTEQPEDNADTELKKHEVIEGANQSEEIEHVKQESEDEEEEEEERYLPLEETLRSVIVTGESDGTINYNNSSLQESPPPPHKYELPKVTKPKTDMTTLLCSTVNDNITDAREDDANFLVINTNDEKLQQCNLFHDKISRVVTRAQAKRKLSFTAGQISVSDQNEVCKTRNKVRKK